MVHKLPVRVLLFPDTPEAASGPPWDSAKIAEENRAICNSLSAEERAALEADAHARITAHVREVCPTCGKQIRFSEDYGRYCAGTLHFETREELQQALNAPEVSAALLDFDAWLRGQIKYQNRSEFQPVRDELYRLLGEYLTQ